MYMTQSETDIQAALRRRVIAGHHAENFYDDQLKTDPFSTDTYRALSRRLYHAIFERIDLERLQQLSGEQFRRELALLIERILDDEKLPVNQAERRRLVQEMQYEMTGLGPIEPLLNDPTISDILVNSQRQVYIERRGR